MQDFQFTMRRSCDGPDEPIPATEAPAQVVRAQHHISQTKRAAYMRAYAREWRKTHPLAEEQKCKDACRSYAGVYLKRGKLTREPCFICDGDGVEMHHPDYSKPLNVVWLCRKHHLDLHKLGF